MDEEFPELEAAAEGEEIVFDCAALGLSLRRQRLLPVTGARLPVGKDDFFLPVQERVRLRDIVRIGCSEIVRPSPLKLKINLWRSTPEPSALCQSGLRL